MPSLPIHVRRVVAIIGVAVLVFVILEFNRRLEELNLLTAQAKKFRAEVTQAVQTQHALQTAVAYANSTAAVDEWARVDGHYIKDGDLPVVPVEAPGEPPLILETPIPTPTPMQNWEVWYTLFFGD